ncbi:MAG TPA: LacI family DNA-binding transcriptional regulator [Rhizomicrobium sp.]
MATIKDVARRAGVGIGTVSRVITGRGIVSAKTAKKVHRIIDELAYRPSRTARRLQAGMSHTIGVFLPVIHGAFYTPMLHAIYKALWEHELHMVVAFGKSPDDERQQAIEGVRFLTDHGCDGLLIMATALKLADVVSLTAVAPRIALLNRYFPSYAEACFIPDHKKAGAVAAQALWQAGHRRVAVIEGPDYSKDNAARMRGFYKTMAACGVDIDGIPVFRGDFAPSGGWAGAQSLLSGKKKFSALFCANDEMALGAISYLHHIGVSVPGDISVLGYDGLDVATYAAPPLTTVRMPWTELALSAVNFLLNQCYEFTLPVERNQQATLVWRDSVAKIGR